MRDANFNSNSKNKPIITKLFTFKTKQDYFALGEMLEQDVSQRNNFDQGYEPQWREKIY